MRFSYTPQLAKLVCFLFISAMPWTSLLSFAQQNEKAKPNFIVIFADDLGYGDLGIFGHPSIKTPHLDQMAYEGQKWTNFYVAASVCTPSRAGLLTGRLPVRSGMASDKRRVLFPDSKGGLPQSEQTIARILKNNGYRTAAVGKWHLGHLPSHLPTDHGFDSYFGIPYSNDMNRTESIEGKNWIESQIQLAENERYQAYNVPLMRDDLIIEQPTDQRTITKRYTEEVVDQIKRMKDDPFFIYLAHSLPHIPLFRSEEFKETSLGGIYGDVIEEIDWSVGQILQTLKDEGLAENTLVVFTSDNGPWHIFQTHGGSAGMLRGAKGGTFEGGMREPTIFWWPGKLKQGVVMDMGTTMDLLPTFSNLSGTSMPDDRIYDAMTCLPYSLEQEKVQGNRLSIIMAHKFTPFAWEITKHIFSPKMNTASTPHIRSLIRLRSSKMSARHTIHLCSIMSMWIPENDSISQKLTQKSSPKSGEFFRNI